MNKKQTATITNFVKNECANFITHYQECLDEEPCRVLCGERCGYFEQAVLGRPDYKYRLPNYDYAKLYAQYAELTGATYGTVEQRRCDCGTPLRLRQKFCLRCAKIRRKQSYQNIRRKKKAG